VEEYRALAARAKDPSLTAEERAAAEAAAKLKIAAIQAKQREVKAYIERAGGSAASQAQFRSRSAESRGAAAVAGEISAITFTPAGDQRVSLRLPQVDPATAFSAYERVAGIRILRDPSIAGVTGTVDLQTGPSTRPELIQALQAALRDQVNIVLEPTTDGNFIAKLGPPR